MMGSKGLVLLVALVAPPSAHAQDVIQAVPATEPKLPTVGQFRFEIDGVEVAQFEEAIIDETADPPTVTFRRGRNTSPSLLTWHEATHNTQRAGRVNVTFTMFNENGEPVRYQLENAWSSEMVTRQPRRGGNDIVIETITIQSERIVRVQFNPKEIAVDRSVAWVSLTIEGQEIARFSELVSMDASSSPPTIVLRRGKEEDSTELRLWHEAAHTIQQGRKSASLVMYDYDGKPVARYYLESAWPSKIEIGALRAGASEVLMETVTIVSEHIQRVSP